MPQQHPVTQDMQATPRRRSKTPRPASTLERPPRPSLRVAYLVNQYPLGSHTFIRREIAALEAEGIHVERLSIRDTRATLTDAADIAEAHKTGVLFQPSPRAIASLVSAVLRQIGHRPTHVFSALREALRFGHRADRRIFVPCAYLAEAARLVEILAEKDIHHVHAHFGTNSATVAMLAHMMGGPGFSFTAHGPEEFDRADALGLREKIAHARFVAGVSAFGKSQLLRHTTWDAWSKVTVVPCGVDDAFIDENIHVPVPLRRRIVCVGRLCEQKGHLVLLQSAAELAARGCTFEIAIVGDGELRADIQREISRKRIEKHVTLMGWADTQHVRAQILDSRALVLPSFAEGLPVVLMEALALGRPVIATHIAGIPELVEPGNSGWLVPAGDPIALADAMESVFEASPQMLDGLGKAGRRRVLERHDARLGARLLADAFHSIFTPATDTACGVPNRVAS